MTPINSGFSIILNPAALFPKYLTKEIIETSNKLEEGLLEYKGNENIVKYETLYGGLAAERKMVAVYLPVYWADLGTEEKLLAAEAALQHTSFFKASL
jgi:NDP-sugar pyrophosphorylase family protein